MDTTTYLAFVHALSPLHAGTGQGTGIIDLPIAREKATGLPYLPGSSLKGTLRARCSNADERRRVFGPDMNERPDDDNHASSAQFSDQRLLLLPIRSLAGTFAWVTSPYILRRLARDIKDAQLTPPTQEIPQVTSEEICTVASETSKIVIEENIYLEDLMLKKGERSTNAQSWAEWISERIFPDDPEWQTIMQERFCIVHDDIFNFLIDVSMEIRARIKLKEDTKTVQEGGLWYEESLPTEAILSGLVLATPTKQAKTTSAEVFRVLQGLMNTTLQFGGNATVGHGICRIQIEGATGRGA